MRTSAAPNAEGIRRVGIKRVGLMLNVKMACSGQGDVMRTAGVHAGRGDCNRAVEVCVSGFGTQIEIAGETIRGSGSNGSSNGWSVRSLSGRVCRLQARRDAQKETSRGVIFWLWERSEEEKKTQQQYTRGFRDDEEKRMGWKEIQVCQSVRRVEARSSRGKTGEWENGGRGW